MTSGNAEIMHAVAFVSLGVALLICLNATTIAELFNVFSHPDPHRRRHKHATPQVGGIAILFGAVIWTAAALVIGAFTDDRFLLALLLCATGVGAVGFIDDQKEISPLGRIVLLLIFMGAAFTIEPGFITPTLNWGSFLPTSIPLWLYLPLMGATTVGLVNAVNMADGQNGIVGGLYTVWAFCLLLATHGASAAMAGVLMSLSVLFLAFNLPGRIFLGDCGSYGVTFIIGLLVTIGHAHGNLTLDTIVVWFFIPVVDCVRLLVSRPLRGRSPLEGDRDHFHHRLEDRVGKIWGATIYVGTVALTSGIATLAPRFALVCLCALCAFYFSFAWLTDPEAVLVESENSSDSDKVVPIGDGNRRQPVA